MTKMDPEEYRKALERIGISNERFCRVIGMNPSTGWKYARGVSAVSPPMAALLRVLLALNVDAAKLMELLPEDAKTAPPEAKPGGDRC